MTKKDTFLFFDTEMSGCEQIVSIGYILTDSEGNTLSQDYYLIKPRKPIRKSTIAIHGITTGQAKKEGISLKKGLARLFNAVKDSMVVVGFAPQNDILALAIGAKIIKREVPFIKGESIVVDVARLGTPYMIEKGQIQPGQTPNLCALYTQLFDGETYDEHNALNDAIATARCFWRLMEIGEFTFKSIIPQYKILNLCNTDKPHKQSKKTPKVDTVETTEIAYTYTEITTTEIQETIDYRGN